MESLLDRGDLSFYALINMAGQYSLWPQSLPVPDGWKVAKGPAEKDICLEYIESNWRALDIHSTAC
ncbi:MbtH family protein [Pseudomonas aeruginosa]|nr:MbtH family protein [Pseudomonas aeruginosa]